MADNNSLSVIFGGDVGPVAQPVGRLAELIQPLLDSADYRVAQCERTYSDRGYFPEWSTIPGGRHTRVSSDLAAIFKLANIDVVSVASNHAMDWGYDALEDTIANLSGMEMRVIGGGPSSSDARMPAILEKSGVRVAVLAYCSILREGQAAVGGAPGVAPLRAHTAYEPIDFQPGCPPLIRSWAFQKDIEAAQEDIRQAKQNSDAVTVFLHWGLRHIPKVLAEYQQPLAHALIDAGADVIVGHHPHTPKAIEWYRGGLCFYSIGNFLTTGASVNNREPSGSRWNLFWYESASSTSLYSFPEHCRRAILPRLTFGSQGLVSASVIPVYMNDLAQPEPLEAGDPRFDDAMANLEWVSDQHPHGFARGGNEIAISLDEQVASASARL